METTSGNTPCILVVDDCTDHVLSIQAILGNVAAKVLTADSGQAALELSLVRGDIAVILMSTEMRKMDGYVTAELLRINQNTNAVPIIFVSDSANEQPKLSSVAYQSGAVDFINRPVQPQILLGKVRVFLDLKRQQRLLDATLIELGDARDELAKSNGALDDFAHTAAHDLQAPLRHIRYFLEVVEDDYGQELRQEVTESLSRADGVAARMQGMVRGLLGYARIGASSLSPRPVSLEKVVAEVLHEKAGEIKECGAQVTVGSGPVVHGDPVMLHQLFQILISNSLKYRAQDRQPIIKISFNSTAGQGKAQITVQDNGIGFEETYAETLFKPFKRLVAKDAYEGAGIGLATAKRIVDRHNGTIGAHGEIGCGAFFTLELPLPKQLFQVLVCGAGLIGGKQNPEAWGSLGISITTVSNMDEVRDFIASGVPDAVVLDPENQDQFGGLEDLLTSKHPDTFLFTASSDQDLPPETGGADRQAPCIVPRPIQPEHFRQFVDRISQPSTT